MWCKVDLFRSGLATILEVVPGFDVVQKHSGDSPMIVEGSGGVFGWWPLFSACGSLGMALRSLDA